MELEDQLYDLAMAYWELEKKNYDIKFNYPELLEFGFVDPDLKEKLDEIIARCELIRGTEKPPPEPDVANIFRNDIAPVPNNSVLSVVARAIMAGGDDFALKSGGWHKQGEALVYEDEFEKAGNITVSIEDCPDHSAFVKSLSVFTLDVFMSVIGHLCHAFSKSKIDNPLSMRSILTARKILVYKNVKSYGERRWNMFENIAREMKKLEKIRISLQNGQSKGEFFNYSDTRLIHVKVVKRDFNGNTKNYVTSSWEVKPGQWAVYTMSKKRDKFIGKLSRAVLGYDHREQRGPEAFAKKLMVALFVLPGGTHYIRNGAKKSLEQYLRLLGEYRVGDDLDRKMPTRTIDRFGKALDFLVEQKMIRTSIDGSVYDYMTIKRAPWCTQKLMDTVIEIKLENSL